MYRGSARRVSSAPGSALRTADRSSTTPALLPCHLGECEHLIEASIAGIRQHLQSYHPDIYRPSGSGRYVKCCWQDGKSCAAEVVHSGVAKHIAVVHLKLTHTTCPYCAIVLSRSDALLRHIRKDCRSAPLEDRLQYTVGSE